MIDFAFARLSLRRLGNNKAGGIDAAATLYCVFPARNLGYESNDKAATRHILLFLCIVSCKPDNAQNNKSHSKWSGFIIAFASLVIPAVEAAWLVYLKRSKRCAIFVVFTHTTLTL